MTRFARVFGPAVLLLVAIALTIVGLIIGGGATPLTLQDPGPVVRWGLPFAKLLVNLGASGMIGGLVLTLFALSPKHKAFNAALDFAAGCAAVLTVASATVTLLIYLTVTGTAFSLDERFGAGLGQFLTQIPLGQAWLATTLLAAVATVAIFAVRNHTALVFVLALAVYTLVPMAQQGHAAGTAGHNAAVTGLGLHLLFAAIWLGGLLTIVFLQRHLTEARLITVLERYSTLALVCFIVVAISGYISAELRIGSLDRLLSPYGILVLGKVGALVALGVFGVMQRGWLIEKLRRTASEAATQPKSAAKPRRTPFWWLIVAELAFMGVASGFAAALGRTATPVPQELPSIPTPAQLLTGEPLPPELTIARYFTEWNLDLIWVLASAFGIFFYLMGVWRLHKRGDRWPVLRTVSWVTGMVLLFYITNGGVNVYERYLFSSHMLAHMVLAMAVPVLLVPGAPVTLAMRAIKARKDGSRGPREWILIAVHSRFAGIITNPLVAAAIFVFSLWVFYYSPLLRWSMVDHMGHEWMIVHFLISGYLFVQSLIGIDPVPYRLQYPFRLLLLLGTMAFHAFFGLTLMTGTGLLISDWYGAMGRPWGADAITDQQNGGGIAWGIGELPTLALAIAVAVQWGRSDTKESKRRDRNAERTGEAELNAYNERLARLALRDDETVS